ncbi:unnamed protein product [Dovyalis caffra]|uniref:Alcohol dehydrogenase N-terminal domain-containing protein n=1 Tax=Dovyalis caffra TaxID=77055 RepID=A0AAV1SXF5_9ROSI|nr:unnamed protein product [Dovyalis caffra]
MFAFVLLCSALGKDDSKNKHEDLRYPLVPGHEIVGIVKDVALVPILATDIKADDHIGSQVLPASIILPTAPSMPSGFPNGQSLSGHRRTSPLGANSGNAEDDNVMHALSLFQEIEPTFTELLVSNLQILLSNT